jgi:outer membrane protein TolC
MLDSRAVHVVESLFARRGSGLLLLRRVAVFLLLAFPVLALSQEMTLDQAVSLALKNNRLIKIAQLDVSKAEHDTQAMRTNRFPQLKLNMMQGQLLTDVTFTFPPGSMGTFPGVGPFPPTTAYITTPRRPFTLIQAQANQPLSQLYRIGLGVDAKKLDTEIAKEKLSLQEQSIVNDVKKTYYNMVQAQSALDATEETITLLKEMNRIAANGLEQQVILKSDMLDAEAGLAKAEFQATTLQDTVATLKEKMNDLLARDLETEFTVSKIAEPEPWEMDLAAARAKAIDQRPEIREARLKAQEAEIDRRAKKAEYIPDISLSMNYLSPFDIKFLPENITAIGVALNWDVFDWGRKNQELAAKAEVVEQAKSGVDEATAQIQVEVGQDFRKLAEARQQLRVADLELDADREKVRVALNKYDEKAILLKDVLQMKASLAEKTYTYQESLLSYWTARADLEKAIGER